MNKVYSKHFVIGFCVNILIFVVLNIIDFVVAKNEYENSGEHLSHDTGATWGIPFSMFGVFYIGFSPIALCVNILLVIFFSFFMGYIFKFLLPKITSRGLK